MSVAVHPIQHVEWPVCERENSDWLLSLANESVYDNESKSDEREQRSQDSIDLEGCYNF